MKTTNKVAIITPSVEEIVRDLQNDGSKDLYDKLLAIIFDRVLFCPDLFPSQTYEPLEVLRLLTTLRELLFGIANPYATPGNYYIREESDI